MSNIILSDGKLHTFGEDLPSIEVVAFALSHINRYNGHVGGYSVAQHSVHCSHFITESLALDALLHDVPEAIYGDISRPLKRFLDSDALEHLETSYHNQVDHLYGVATRCATVADCDLRMLITEAKSFGFPLEHFPDAEPYDLNVDPWPAEVAEVAFMRRFRELTGDTVTRYRCTVDGVLGSVKSGRKAIMAACPHSRVNGGCGAHGNFKCDHKRKVNK